MDDTTRVRRIAVEVELFPESLREPIRDQLEKDGIEAMEVFLRAVRERGDDLLRRLEHCIKSESFPEFFRKAVATRTIVILKRPNDYQAVIKGDRGTSSVGKTASEALGRLLLETQRILGIGCLSCRHCGEEDGTRLFVASLYDNPAEVQSSGTTMHDAFGNLLRTHVVRFGIIIEQAD